MEFSAVLRYGGGTAHQFSNSYPTQDKCVFIKMLSSSNRKYAPLDKKSSYKYDYSLLVLARWEVDTIAEWISYYKFLGFDHIYLYCNDDDPRDLYVQVLPYTLGSTPFLTFVHYPHQGHQWWMWMHYLRTFKRESEWIAIFDIDEYLNLPRHDSIKSFMSSIAGNSDCVYFYWTYFGANGFEKKPTGSVISNYIRRQSGLDPNTKMITKTCCIYEENLRHEMQFEPGFVYINHGWTSLTAPGIRSTDVIGNSMEHYYVDYPRQFVETFSNQDNIDKVFETAVLHHYAFRTTDDYIRRVNRGTRGSHWAQNTWTDAVASGYFQKVLETTNAEEDTSLKKRWERYIASQPTLQHVFTIPSEPLISRNKSALQSSVWPCDDQCDLAAAAATAVSGDFTGICNVCTDAEQSPWWQVDLSQDYLIAEIRIYNRVDVSALMARDNQFALLISSDAENWREVFRKSDDAIIGGIDGKPFLWRPEPTLKARFVRMKLTRPEYLNIDQFEVYGYPVT